MEGKGVVASLALHTVLEPVFAEVRKRCEVNNLRKLSFQMEREESLLASVQTLRDAFTKVRVAWPVYSTEKYGIFLVRLSAVILA